MEDISHVYDIKLGINLADSLKPERKEGIKYLLNVLNDADLPETYMNYIWTRLKEKIEKDPVLSKLIVLDVTLNVIPEEAPTTKSTEEPKVVPATVQDNSSAVTNADDSEKSTKQIDQEFKAKDSDMEAEKLSERSGLNPDERMLVDSVQEVLQEIITDDSEVDLESVNFNSELKSTVELDNIIESLTDTLMYGFKDMDGKIAEIKYNDRFGNPQIADVQKLEE